MDILNEILSVVNAQLWGWPMIVLLLGTHVYLTIILRFPQRKILTAIRLSVKRDPGATGDVSQFRSLATALAATIGTGNIIGVATAIALGGPGAVLWCWLTGVFGISTKYAEGLLAIKYRVKTEKGRMLGGPMYALERGLGWKWLAVLFALFTALASFGIGNTVQANAIATVASETYDISPALTGAVICLLTGAVVLGGVKSIARVCGLLVPFMALFYVLGCLYILCVNASYLWPALKLIVHSAFSPQAAGGGIMGYTFAQVITKGMARGVFSNEAGLGSSVIAHSASETREPVKQGLWGVFEVFFDTFIICTLTALTFLTTFDVSSFTGSEPDELMSMSMFSTNFGDFGTIVFSIILPLFAFTTIIAWSYYGEKAIEFCFGWTKENHRKTITTVFKFVYVLLIAVSSTIQGDLIWAIDDTFNGLMAVPNLICLIALNGLVAKITKNYFDRKRGKKVAPMLSAYPDMNEEFKHDIMTENAGMS